jgi:4'-phosphopantetheinyl transferase
MVIEMTNLLTRPEIHLDRPSAGEIHVWYAELDRPDTAHFFSLLSQDEKDKADRFIFEQDKVRYTTRRGILRILLGSYLGIEPYQIRFDYSHNNKPALAEKYNRSALYFNQSCSERMAVFAFTSGCEIGIDIEYIRDVPEMQQIFERFFSPGENEVFQTLSANLRKEAFFNCWTRKEAFIKATGDGLSRPLNTFDVSLMPGEPARLLEIERCHEEVNLWFMNDLKVTPGYAAALAMKGNCINIRSRQWTGQH